MTAFKLPPIILVILIFVLFWKCDTYCVILYLGLVTTRRSTICEDITTSEEILIGSVWLMVNKYHSQVQKCCIIGLQYGFADCSLVDVTTQHIDVFRCFSIT